MYDSGADTTRITGSWPSDAENPGLGITVTASFPGSFFSTDIWDASSSNFAAQPIGLQTFLSTGAGLDWTLIFSAPVDLYLYGVYWRGGLFASGEQHYTFDAPVAIASGFTSATATGNTLTLPNTVYHHGILAFSDLTSLHVCPTLRTFFCNP